VYLNDGSFVDIRYPLPHEYSLHWQKGSEVFRVNTAPDHHEIATYPRHIHQGRRFKEDDITDPALSPEENVRRFLKRVKTMMKQTE